MTMWRDGEIGSLSELGAARFFCMALRRLAKTSADKVDLMIVELVVGMTAAVVVV